MSFDYNAHVTAARIFYETTIPRINGYSSQRGEYHGLPYVFSRELFKLMLGQN